MILRTERTVTFALDGSTGTFEQDQVTHLVTASQTTQLGSELRKRLGVTLATIRTDGLLPNPAGSDTPTANFGDVTTQPRWTASAAAEWVVSPSVFVTGRVAYFPTDTRTENIGNEPRYVFARSNIGLPGVPPSLQRVTGFSSDTTHQEYLKDRRSRLGVQLDATWHVRAWGEHALKAGVQADRIGHDLDRGDSSNSVLLVWDRAHLFDQATPVSFFSTETESGAGLTFREADFYAGGLDFAGLFQTQNVRRDPRFLMADGYQPPRTIRLMLKWSF